MGIWTDLATWVGPTPNSGGVILRYLYVVEHIADGSFDGTIAWQKNPTADVSSHFIVAKDGRIAQMVDTNRQSWTQIQGNPYSISIENEGHTGDSLTPAQVEASARLLERAHREHGIPLQVTNRVGTPGLGHHSMGYESGVNWGHQFCPGEPIKAQKGAIVAQAIDISGGTVSDSTLVTNMATRISQWQHGADKSEPVPGSDLNGESSWLVGQLKKIDALTAGGITPETLAAAVATALTDPAVLAALSPTLEQAAQRGAAAALERVRISVE